jgi:Predicted transcriptional regulator
MKGKIKILVCLFAFISSANAQVGKTVSNVKLVDVKDTPRNLPFIGEKVLAVFYIDPDVQDVADPLTDALEARKFPKERFGAIGIVNCKDTWIPNNAIIAKSRQKQERFPQSVIMLDKSAQLTSAWQLGRSNNAAIVIIVGKDSKIKLIKTVKSREESKALIASLIRAVEDELKM